ncbi:OmpH family outer membrane protein [Pseudorhodobacter sp. E13]|uniref:OmpH family outer membrane protein n=1 Tax=Pseudorhodobacter sp. E13 TaxID=2487931 RepID=UPI000F8E7C2D|nr:OmpH family outer membrane protein [Pseudorhodobacter sp. E13]RUS60594.1 OmpH family outer membrane protein [Pseudorhodobacter sp. E13]
MSGARATASLWALLAAFGASAFPALAQDNPAATVPALTEAADVPFQSQVLTINQQRLFEDSAFGKASLARLEADSRNLQAEIRQIESDLEIEERMLTERRAELPTAEFQPLARAFDEKVENIRAAWSAKDRDLKRQREADQQAFFETAVPILAALMRDMGAVALIDQSSVVLSLDRVDVTQMAIDRLDAAFATQQDAAPEAPVPEAATPTDAPSQP